MAPVLYQDLYSLQKNHLGWLLKCVTFLEYVPLVRYINTMAPISQLCRICSMYLIERSNNEAPENAAQTSRGHVEGACV